MVRKDRFRTPSLRQRIARLHERIIEDLEEGGLDCHSYLWTVTAMLPFVRMSSTVTSPMLFRTTKSVSASPTGRFPTRITGNPEYGVELQPIDFAAFAHACGGVGFTVKIPANAVMSWMNFWTPQGRRSYKRLSIRSSRPCPRRSKRNKLCTLPNRCHAVSLIERKSRSLCSPTRSAN
jgi:hypothetical protein